MEEISFDDVLPPKDLLLAKKNGSITDKNSEPSVLAQFPGSSVSNTHIKQEMKATLHDTEIFTCEFCFKKYMNFLSLSKHYNRVHKIYFCFVCYKKFSSRRMRDEHTVIHPQEKTYTCSKCQKQFTEKDRLKDHTCITTGKKLPFSYDFSQKQFAQAEELGIHAQSHSFSCNICKKRFENKFYLFRHTFIHAGKSFTCSVCGKDYTCKTTFNKHVLRHSSETCITFRHKMEEISSDDTLPPKDLLLAKKNSSIIDKNNFPSVIAQFPDSCVSNKHIKQETKTS